MNGRWRLSVRDDFSAGHALRGYHGKCENMHGHNFTVEITVEGSELDEKSAILLDFKTLKKILKESLATLDHRLLNDFEPFNQINPSSENLARFIFRQIEGLLKQNDDPRSKMVKLISVSVSEKPGQQATYFQN